MIFYRYGLSVNDGGVITLPAPVAASQLHRGAHGSLWGRDKSGRTYFFGLDEGQASSGINVEQALPRTFEQAHALVNRAAPQPSAVRSGISGEASFFDIGVQDFLDKYHGEAGDVLSINAGTAPRITSTSELSARIKAAGGSLVVSPYSSEMIVAKNNDLQFSTKKLADGTYRVTDRGYATYYMIGGAALAVVLLFFRS